MKNSMHSVRVLVVSFMAALSLGSFSPALANGGGDSVELKYIGKIKNQPLFQLNFLGNETNEYTIVVRDEYSNVLYRDVIKGGNNNRKFMLTEETANAQIRFEITGKSLDKPVIFEINNSSRTIEDVVVNQVRR